MKHELLFMKKIIKNPTIDSMKELAVENIFLHIGYGFPMCVTWPFLTSLQQLSFFFTFAMFVKLF